MDRKEYQHKWYIKNKEHHLKLHRIWCKNNHKYLLEYSKQHHKANRIKRNEYSKQYRKDHHNEIKEYNKEYCIDNAEKIKKYMKQYRIDNHDKEKARNKQWNKNNSEKVKIYGKQYRLNNREKLIEWRKQWQENNPEWKKQYRKYKRKTDLKFNLNERMGTLMWYSLKKGKAGRTWRSLIDYTIDDLMKHLKKTMPESYDWQDYMEGRLHIDHIIPISVFNFTKPEHTDFQRCWALENLRLLPARENLDKRAKLFKSFQPALKI